MNEPSRAERGMRGVGAVVFALLALLSLAPALFFLTRRVDVLVLFIASPFVGVTIVFALAAAACVNSRWTFPALGSFYGAVGIGGIGFAAGFVGPMIFTPDANQGPLLGIFFTGPGGVFVGAIVGALLGEFALRRWRRPQRHLPWGVGASGSAHGGN